MIEEYMIGMRRDGRRRSEEGEEKKSMGIGQMRREEYSM